jgi:hypothetical protein
MHRAPFISTNQVNHMTEEQEALAALESEVEAWTAADPYGAAVFVQAMLTMLGEWDQQQQQAKRAGLRVVDGGKRAVTHD